jgi:myosin heavy subunit
MVSFVVNTNNYKVLYEQQKNLYSTSQAEVSELSRLYDEQKTKMAELQSLLEAKILNLQESNNKLIADLQNAERQSQEYQARADSWKGVLTGFEQSIRSLQESLRLTQNQLDQARAQGIKDSKELNQITSELYEKLVQLEAMEADRRRLLEQKKELETQVGSGFVSAPASVSVVTPLPGPARPAAGISIGADIRGLITEVNANMVTLSVGSADGVQKGMVFHVTRGDQFLCDVAVTNVDINKSAGVLELIQQQPRIGDTASTRL